MNSIDSLIGFDSIRGVHVDDYNGDDDDDGYRDNDEESVIEIVSGAASRWHNRNLGKGREKVTEKPCLSEIVFSYRPVSFVSGRRAVKI